MRKELPRGNSLRVSFTLLRSPPFSRAALQRMKKKSTQPKGRAENTYKYLFEYV